MEIGARLPPGYEYQDGSAFGFPGNLSRLEPEETQDVYGAGMLKWVFSEPRPIINLQNPVKTQIFYVTGSGELEGDYTWVVAARSDIGIVGEIQGTLYIITSTATEPGTGEVTGRIVAEILEADSRYILSWQISR
jgi:hypothetical protein